jgi:hypothetical protein
VIAIRRDELPGLDETYEWTGSRWAAALRHIPSNADFNPSLRQLLHVSFKLAAKKGTRYTDLLKANREIVAKNVFENLYDRHMRPLFIG